jgi:hypothetical protein
VLVLLLAGCVQPSDRAAGDVSGARPDVARAREPVQAELGEQDGVDSAVGSSDPLVHPRPKAWAQPLELKGLPNLHRVSPVLYRGAQPTEQGFRELEKLGVRTVLSLRAFHADEPLPGSRLAFERISFKSGHPEREDVLRFLAIVTDPERQPVFVHCQHGADRTGTMCAITRIVLDGWTKQAAIEEMTSGGYGFHSIWPNLITYVRELDVEDLVRVGAPAATSRPARSSDHADRQATHGS